MHIGIIGCDSAEDNRLGTLDAEFLPDVDMSPGAQLSCFQARVSVTGGAETNRMAAVFILYSALLALGLLLTSPYWVVQMLRLGKYRAGLAERLGRVPERICVEDARPAIWIHAVSVGEVLAISGLVAALRQAMPGYRVLVSTTTHTGQKLARDRFGAENVFYFPLDFAFCIRPYVTALRPALLVVAETEFWPNFLRVVRTSGAHVAVVNARISDRSFPRYRRWRGLLARVLRYVDLFLAQSEEDARRLREISAPADCVHVSGNLKFDVKPPEEAPVVAELRRAIAQSGAGPIIVAGSTVEGEEEQIVGGFETIREQYPRSLLILAPRHKERFAAVSEILSASGIQFVGRSAMTGDSSLAGSVLLLDTLGELASVYALADVAFVGGSLVPRGGHNILEPAHWGVATVVGPHTENFRDILGIFRRADAVRIAQPEALADVLLELLRNEPLRRGLGERARKVVEEQMGATERTLEALRALIE
jgi:3-deoxy-D-manno-octulosonic-acid transferase